MGLIFLLFIDFLTEKKKYMSKMKFESEKTNKVIIE